MLNFPNTQNKAGQTAGYFFDYPFRVLFASTIKLESMTPPDSETSYDRELGVVEALTSVANQCPHAGIRTHAEAALARLAEDGPDVLPQQAFLVLSTIAGWRGERAQQVKRSLRAFLDQHGGPSPS